MRTQVKNIEECREIANKHNYNSFRFQRSLYNHCYLHNFHPFHLKLLKETLKPITKTTDWVHGIINTNNKLSDISEICRNYVDKTQSHRTGMISQKIVAHKNVNINGDTKENLIYKF